MKKTFPFMPFYTSDWLADEKVRVYSLEQKGAYHELLVYMWQSPDGHLPDDDPYLAKLLGISLRKWRTLRHVIIDGQYAALHRSGERISQSRLLEEWRKARAINAKRAKAGAQGGSKRASKPQANAKQMDSKTQAYVEQKSSTSEAYNNTQGTDHKVQGTDQVLEPPSESPGPEVESSLRESSTSSSEDIGSNDSTNMPGDDTCTQSHQSVIRDLTAQYRAIIPVNQCSDSDWAKMGQVYSACGRAATQQGIAALARQIRNQKSIRNPLAYVGQVARHPENLPRPRDSPRPDPGAKTDEVGMDALPNGPPAWKILQSVWEE